MVRRCALKHVLRRLLRSGDGVVSSSSSSGFVRLSASRFRIGGMPLFGGLVILSHNLWCGDSVSDIDSNVRSGVTVASAVRR